MSEYTEGPWIEHTTGEMPVPGDTMVRWRTKSGHESAEARKAEDLVWGRDGIFATLTHYRIQADKDGWIRHVPGDSPVSGDTDVTVILRDGSYRVHKAAHVYWAEEGATTVERYRVATGSVGKETVSRPDTTIEALISAAIAYKDATTHQQEALERLNEAVKALKGK